jgi:hypothetical protein
MYPANHPQIRSATPADAAALRRIAEYDSADPLTGDVLVALIGDDVVAALSLSTGRAIADPFRRTAYAVTQLRLRAAGIAAFTRQPSLRERIFAGVRTPAHVQAGL